MNGCKLYREYARYKGYDCHEFVKVENDWDGLQEFKFKDSKGNTDKMIIVPADMVNWIIRSFDNNIWDNYKGKKNDI